MGHNKSYDRSLKIGHISLDYRVFLIVVQSIGYIEILSYLLTAERLYRLITPKGLKLYSLLSLLLPTLGSWPVLSH